jgi:hypothetical protein
MSRKHETTAQRHERHERSVRLRSRRSTPKPGANCSCRCRQCSYGYHCGPCSAEYRAHMAPVITGQDGAVIPVTQDDDGVYHCTIPEGVTSVTFGASRRLQSVQTMTPGHVVTVGPAAMVPG